MEDDVQEFKRKRLEERLRAIFDDDELYIAFLERILETYEPLLDSLKGVRSNWESYMETEGNN